MTSTRRKKSLFKRFSLQAQAYFIIIAITAVVAFTVIFDLHPPLVGPLEMKSRDLRFIIRGIEKPPGNVVIAAVDDKSLKALGRWPWPRSYPAELVRLLHDGGASVIGIDLLFSEPESNPQFGHIQQLMRAFQELGLTDLNIKTRIFHDEMAETLHQSDNDAILGAIIRNTRNVILSCALVNYPTETVLPPPLVESAALMTLNDNETMGSIRPYPFKGILLPIAPLLSSSLTVGFVNVLPDMDGSVRRSYALLRHDDHLYASLPIRIAQHYLNQNEDTLLSRKTGNLRVGRYEPPITNNALIHINYYGPVFTLPYYSIVDILSGKVKPEIFKDKCVIIGGAAVGLGDHWANPYSGNFWGVETQATIVENLIAGRFLSRPDWTVLIDLGILFILAVIMGIGFTRMSINRSIILFFVLIVSVITVNQYAFEHHHLFLSWMPPIIQIALTAATIMILRYAVEGREKRLLKAAFQQYINPSVVNRIIRSPENLALGGEKKELTVMFSDIRDFTRISENISPERLVYFINRYLTAMTNIILDNEGTLDKYIGDCIMAIYGAPEEQANSAYRACLSAIQMNKTLAIERETWKRDGLPSIFAGIGIHTGLMVVGNLGSEKRFDYTVMGDNVNLASRLEGLTKIYGVDILVSEFTQKLVEGDFIFRELDKVQVKGKERTVTIFELIDERTTDREAPDYIEHYSKGLHAYRNKDFEAAIHCFQTVCELKPEDPPSYLLIERCNTLMNASLPDNWTGVFRVGSK